MRPVKWKLYQILNYVMLVIASIIFLIIGALVLGGNTVERSPAPYLVELGFLIMVTQYIMNLIVYSQNFPHKRLLGKALTMHVIAIVFNFIGFLGLSLITTAGAVIEFGEDNDSEDQTGKLMLGLFLLMWMITAFLLFCQLTLNRYLKRRNTDLFTTMIDSIGTKNDDQQ